MTRLRLAALVGMVAAVVVTVGSPAQAATFSNSNTITINDTGCGPPDAEKATPYPSTISVSGLTGTVSDVNVTLNGVTHPFEGDLELLLVGPAGGSQNLVLLSDAGTGSLSNATVTFDDSAAAAPPQNTAWGPGTYKPVNYAELSGADAFPSPAPAPSSNTTLAGAFNGIAPNGTWSLYVIDDACPDAGSISGGWTLNITTAAAASATTTSVTSSLNPSRTGQSVTFTATVLSGGNPVTTGTVTFTEGVNVLAANVPVNGSGQATFTTSTLTEGSHIITATYNGTASFATSNGQVDQRVDNNTTQTGNQYCNTGAITAPSAGPATPYPSNIFVTGAPTTLGKVTVQLKNVSHPFAEDLDILLVGPAGQNLILASDAGNGTAATTNVTVTFDDAAANSLPATGAWGPPNSSVTAKPTDYDPGAAADAFAPPAPAPSSATALSVFNGTNPNGTWSLYVIDDAAPDVGSIAGGWCLTLTAPPQADVSISKSDAPDPVVAGSNLTYTINVSNSVAGSTATDVVLNDPLPANTTFVSVTPPGGWSCNPLTPGGTGTLTCTRSSLTPADGPQTFTLVVRVNNQTPSGTPISNTATVQATGDADLLGNNVSTAGTAVTFPISKPAVVRNSTTWLLRSSLTTGPATTTFTYGTRPLVPLFGDWDGNGTKTAGTFEAGTFKLNNANDSSAPDIVFTFGDPRGWAVAGDFDGDGTDDVAVFRNGLWEVRLSTGATSSFSFGSGTWPTTVAVAGDWDGDGIDGIGTFSGGTWSLKNAAAAGPADIVVSFAPGPSPYPVVGDWNGDGIDTIGVKSATGTTWVLSNSNTTPAPDITFDFGQPNTDLPFAWR